MLIIKQLFFKKFSSNSRYIKYVAEKMELTKEQSVMMALFVDNSDDTSITISDFGKFRRLMFWKKEN